MKKFGFIALALAMGVCCVFLTLQKLASHTVHVVLTDPLHLHHLVDLPDLTHLVAQRQLQFTMVQAVAL